MASDTVFCQGCGITLRPFMPRCPRCGMDRPAATPPQMPATIASVPAITSTAPSPAPPVDAPTAIAPTLTVPLAPASNEPPPLVTATTGALPFRKNNLSTAIEPPTPFPPRTTVVPFEGQRRRALMQDEAASAPPPDSIFTSPTDDIRRFPLFTPGQWTMIGAGLGLLALGLLVGYLLWSRDKKDSSNVTLTPNLTVPQTSTEQALPNPAPSVDLLGASPTPELAPMLEGDQALFFEVKKALSAYNPIYHSRYQVAMKDGVVTLTGPAENQPEKDGVSNVLKLVAGLKGITNNLTVKADANAALTGLPTTAQANQAVVTQPTTPAVTPAPENNVANQQAALEAERQRLAREADAQRQRDAEAQRQRDTENQRLEAQRQEADRPRIVQPPQAAAAPVAAAPRVLRSGTVAWSGIVDGLDEIILTGGSASVRHLSGEALREARAAFSAPIPRAPVAVNLLNTSGRGALQIIQEPSAANGYTTIVRIDDSHENGGKPYQFTLRWTAQ